MAFAFLPVDPCRISFAGDGSFGRWFFACLLMFLFFVCFVLCFAGTYSEKAVVNMQISLVSLLFNDRLWA